MHEILVRYVHVRTTTAIAAAASAANRLLLIPLDIGAHFFRAILRRHSTLLTSLVVERKRKQSPVHVTLPILHAHKPIVVIAQRIRLF